MPSSARTRAEQDEEAEQELLEHRQIRLAVLTAERESLLALRERGGDLRRDLPAGRARPRPRRAPDGGLAARLRGRPQGRSPGGSRTAPRIGRSGSSVSDRPATGPGDSATDQEQLGGLLRPGHDRDQERRIRPGPRAAPRPRPARSRRWACPRDRPAATRTRLESAREDRGVGRQHDEPSVARPRPSRTADRRSTVKTNPCRARGPRSSPDRRSCRGSPASSRPGRSPGRPSGRRACPAAARVRRAAPTRESRTGSTRAPSTATRNVTDEDPELGRDDPAVDPGAVGREAERRRSAARVGGIAIDPIGIGGRQEHLAGEVDDGVVARPVRLDRDEVPRPPVAGRDDQRPSSDHSRARCGGDVGRPSR